MGIFIGIMMAEMSILCPFLGEIISGDHGKLPHCPPVWSDPAPASSKSPSCPPRVAGYFRRRRGRRPLAPRASV